jgi:hypothetical protein
MIIRSKNLREKLNLQKMHQVIIIAAQFIFIHFFTKIVFDIILVALKGADYVGYFQLVDSYSNLRNAGIRVSIGI